MPEHSWQAEVSRQVWRLQLIVAAMVIGSLVFLAVVLVLVYSGAAREAALELPLSYVLAVFAVAALAARAVVPAAIVSNARRRIREGVWQPLQPSNVPQGVQAFLEQTGDAGKLWQVLMSRTIIAAATLEGVAFFACITYMLEHSWPSLVVAVVFIACLALHVPSQTGVILWIEEQLRLIDEERQLGR
ncbi:MAG: hypothetical protein HUU20_11920 [Pirellulales bacterium]|nr:hypothetical protein [Pirellulales bacterium]